MWFNVLLFLVGGVTFAYFYMTRNFGWFKARGIDEHDPMFLFGCWEMFNLFTGEVNIVRLTDSIYKKLSVNLIY
jgi:hypothetical protein